MIWDSKSPHHFITKKSMADNNLSRHPLKSPQFCSCGEGSSVGLQALARNGRGQPVLENRLCPPQGIRLSFAHAPRGVTALCLKLLLVRCNSWIFTQLCQQMLALAREPLFISVAVSRNNVSRDYISSQE